MADAFKVVRDFEQALADYTGAKYAVTTTSCTMALLLAVAWHLRNRATVANLNRPDWARRKVLESFGQGVEIQVDQALISVPKRTYVGVPMSIIHAGGRPVFRDENWRGFYKLEPLPVWDYARWFSENMYVHPGPRSGSMICVSFHWSKTLGIQQGGAILHDNHEADEWLRRARFDGREEGIHPKDDKNMIIGYHAYMSPETAAAGLVRLANLPKHNDPLPWGPGTASDYPDLSTMECFK